MRVLFVLFVFAGVASAWPQQQQAAPPAAVFQAPQQSVRVQVPPPRIQVELGQPTVEFVAPAPQVQYRLAAPVHACAPAATFAVPAFYAAPAIVVQTRRQYATPVRDFFFGR